jgi:transposase-like protein
MSVIRHAIAAAATVKALQKKCPSCKRLQTVEKHKNHPRCKYCGKGISGKT